MRMKYLFALMVVPVLFLVGPASALGADVVLWYGEHGLGGAEEAIPDGTPNYEVQFASTWYLEGWGGAHFTCDPAAAPVKITKGQGDPAEISSTGTGSGTCNWFGTSLALTNVRVGAEAPFTLSPSEWPVWPVTGEMPISFKLENPWYGSCSIQGVVSVEVAFEGSAIESTEKPIFATCPYKNYIIYIDSLKLVHKDGTLVFYHAG